MRVPLDWLAEWVPLPASVDALAERLTCAGLEVESIERGPDLSGLRVGHVVERARHPNADRLALCRVDVGEPGAAPREIVCGAPNVAAGQKVAVALPGTLLPDGRRLEVSKIRGVASHGMICSARELGLGEEHAGILVLDPAARVGAPLSEVLGTGGVALEIAITANRGDCASLLGIAREVRALFGGEIALPPCDAPEAGPPARELRVEIADAEGCHRYVGRVVRGVRVGPSPDWLRRKLEAAGQRSINVVVDVTNLVLLELGQPLHAFDLDALAGGVVRVRGADDGEKLAMLDGETRSLAAGDLVIADAERAVALAGVMGGAATQVSERTANVLLESAHFAPARIRRTARRLGLATDASYRFERGVDRAGVQRAADRAARLLAELAGGTVARGRLEATGSAPSGVEVVELELARLNRLLGTSLSEPEVRAALARIDVTAEPDPSGRLRCRVPAHRNDLALPQDLIEEVARVRGYDQIAPSVPAARLDPGHRPEAWDAVEAARDALVHEGLVEVVTFPFLDPADLDRLGLSADDPRRVTVGVRNPLHGAESRLRPTILPTLLRVLRDNRNRQLDRVGLFEVSRIFVAAGGGGSELPRESLRVTAVMTRGEKPGMWEPAPPVPLFFEAKGAAERMLRALDRETELAPGAAEPWLHPGACCSVRAGGSAEPLGVVGELHPAVAEAFGIDLACAVLDMDLGALAALPRAIPRYRDVSPYPSARRDLAVVLDAALPAAEALEAIRREAGSHLQRAEIFDRYAGPGVPDGRVSLAFRLVFQRADGTLTDAEVQAALERVIGMLRHRFGGELR